MNHMKDEQEKGKKTNKQIHPMPKYIWRNKKKDEPISGNRDNKPISGNHKKDEH